MGMGKTLSLIGGLLALVAMFFTALMGIVIVDTATISGFSLINIQTALDGASMAGDDAWKVYVVIGLMVSSSLAGIMMMIGSKVRFLSVLFGFAALSHGVLLILAMLLDIDAIDMLSFLHILFIDEQIVDGILPYYMDVYNGITLGIILLTSGGFLGFIGGLMKRDD